MKRLMNTALAILATVALVAACEVATSPEGGSSSLVLDGRLGRAEVYEYYSSDGTRCLVIDYSGISMDCDWANARGLNRGDQ